MPNDPELPRPTTSATPEQPPTPKEAPPRRDPVEERTPPRHAEDDAGVGGDRMPRGYDEPGAGL